MNNKMRFPVERSRLRYQAVSCTQKSPDESARLPILPDLTIPDASECEVRETPYAPDVVINPAPRLPKTQRSDIPILVAARMWTNCQHRREHWKRRAVMLNRDNLQDLHRAWPPSRELFVSTVFSVMPIQLGHRPPSGLQIDVLQQRLR